MSRSNIVRNTTNIEIHPSWLEPSFHSAYLVIFSKILEANKLPLPRPIIGQPRLLPFLDFLPSLEVFQALHKPEAGIQTGLVVPIAANGPMGLTALTSETPWDAIMAMIRYAPVRNQLFSYHCERQGDMMVLRLSPHVNLGSYTMFLTYSTMMVVSNIIKAILDDSDSNTIRLTFPWETPLNLEPSILNATFQFNCDIASIQLPWSLAMKPSPSADSDLCRRIKLAGEEELAKLKGSIGARVRQLLHQNKNAWPSLQEIADLLAMSKRTLIRKLEMEDLSYQFLLDETRNELACWFLRSSNLSIGVIAEKVGFSDQANFTRSFFRLQGRSPTDYRNSFRKVLDLD